MGSLQEVKKVNLAYFSDISKNARYFVLTKTCKLFLEKQPFFKEKFNVINEQICRQIPSSFFTIKTWQEMRECFSKAISIGFDWFTRNIYFYQLHKLGCE